MRDLRNCDNMELMAEFEDNHFDLAIVDPPYGIGASRPSKKPTKVKQKNGKFLDVINTNSYIQKNWDDNTPNKEYFEELFRVSKNQIIWGANYFPSLIGGAIVWDKLNGDSDQFGCEIAFNSLNIRTDIIRFKWCGMIQGKNASKEYDKSNEQQGNKKLNEIRIHPTQKPKALYKWLLQNYAKEGDKILDTHLGSGSIAIACHEMGFDLTGCELDKDYFEAMLKRIETETAQQDLFK